ncbi:cilia- and flagella-associated protein 97-like [Xenia sp. Carnegie-2017]|uniref:cilia- and flagella-associated protein 97-like n=1 Tax=Xenia sp. Carnegie-2017 TaxID=2897299 RepID=UPI001F03527C|nr:cilia- and flagella-associated protein 97-like [Xenia sp. Carnegie-2017]
MAANQSHQNTRYLQNLSHSSDKDYLKIGPTGRREIEKSDRVERGRVFITQCDSDQVNLDVLLHAVPELDINDIDKSRKMTGKSDEIVREEESKASGFICMSKSVKRVNRTHPRKRNLRENKQNFSFRNDEVVAIDLENQRLLRNISHPRPSSASKTALGGNHSVRVKTSSEVNRKKFQRRIDEENQAILRRLESVKPTKTLNREYLLRNQTPKVQKLRSTKSCHCTPHLRKHDSKA